MKKPLKIVREIKKEFPGLEVVSTGGTHLKAFFPDRKGFVFMSGSPSDVRAMKNMRALIKKLRDEAC